MLGTYKATIKIVKETGRMNIPAKFRKELGDSFYIAKPLDESPCVAVYTTESWNDFLNSEIRGHRRADSYDVKREILPDAFQISMDNQGRVVIPEELCKYAGLENEVIVIGIDDTAEIWDKKAWETRKRS